MILFTATLLFVFFCVWCTKLEGKIKDLQELIDALRQSLTKIKDQNRDLVAELKRTEARIDSGSVTSNSELAEEVKKPPVVPVVAFKAKPAVPPPLPGFFESSSTKMAAKSEVRHPVEPNVKFPAQAEISAEEVPSSFSKIPWRDILKRMHLLPPTKSDEGGTAESQLAAWWVIRIGLMLLIIAAVFFGIHVSQQTPAWLRVVTLGLVSVATIGLGARLRDNLEGFGRAIIGGGFALLFFTAFAAFALPATKIIGSPAVGVLAQFAALVAAIAWSLWKKDQTVATLTLFLALISCGFSHSYDLQRFATVGLVLLAATGAFLFASRGWLTPFIIALVGSWAGFAGFSLLDWKDAVSPSFAQMMGTLVVLTVIFEVGGWFGAARGFLVQSDRLRRWLLLGNTAAAALIGYGLVRIAYPEQLKVFYFITAALFFSFTVMHHLRTTDRAVTESLFLKSSALLCLGFAAAFSGPVRWLAIAFQAFSLLWMARRSGSRWIAGGFALVLAASAAWFYRDLTFAHPKQWSWLNPFHITGALYLIFITAQLALHSRWFPGGIGGTEKIHQISAWVLRSMGALTIGIFVLLLSFTPAFPERSDPLWFMMLLALSIGAVCSLVRSAVPCMAAALPLASSYLAYLLLPQGIRESAAGLCLGVTLIAVAFGVCEAVRRYAPAALLGRAWLREGVLLVGLFTLLPLTDALQGKFSLTGHAAIALFVLYPVVAFAAIICCQLKPAKDQQAHGSALFHSLLGLIILIGGARVCYDYAFFPAVLGIAGLPVLGLAARYRSWKVALAAGFPILGGFFSLWLMLLEARSGEILFDAINLAVLLMIAVGLAIVLWKRFPASKLQTRMLCGDCLLHGLGVFSIHLFFQKYLMGGPAFLASAGLGLGLFAISRRFPFRALAVVSWLPVALACFAGISAQSWQGLASGDVAFGAAGLLILVHLLAAHHFWRGASSEFSGIIAHIISSIAVIAWALITLAAVKDPWQSAALAGVALLCAALWRWRAIARIGHLGLGPLVLAFFMAVELMFLQRFPLGFTVSNLTNFLLTAVGIAANGMLLAAGVRRVLGLKITSASVLPWLHGLGALFIAFTACTMDELVSARLTAVFWGLAAILLFVCGLLAGLRAYRLAGLIGLVFCTGHIFIYDIQDTFYRIIAFFVIGLVMLVIGFLYQRFRDRISLMDNG